MEIFTGLTRLAIQLTKFFFGLFVQLAKLFFRLVGIGARSAKSAYDNRTVKETDFKELSTKQKKKVQHFLENAGLYEKTDKGVLFPPFLQSDGEFYVGILTTQKPEDFEKHLRGIGDIFGKEFIEFQHFNENVYKFVSDALPASVLYEERPSVKGIWLGTDYKGEPVTLDFGHSPAMLITGASGSGKSVLGRVIIEETNKQGFDTYIVDGKGGIDWMHAPCKTLLTDFEEIAEHYEALVNEMNARLKRLVELKAKNWFEAVNQGEQWKPILSFMDESSDFFAVGSKTTDKNYAVKWRIINAVSELCRKSRAAGIYQVFSLQAAKAESVPDDVKNNAAFRVSYALPTSAMSQTLFESAIAFDPTLRHGKGVFKGVEGEPVIFRGAFIAEGTA